MIETPNANLEPPRFETGRSLLIAGLRERYSWETNAGIPAQWQRFQPYVGNIPGQVGGTTYGVCDSRDENGNFDYICGVEVSDFSNLPPELTRVRIPAQRYAVFSHRAHVSTIHGTVQAIWNKWLPDSGHEAANAPNFERYDERFDPRTGMGGFEIWIPIKR